MDGLLITVPKVILILGAALGIVAVTGMIIGEEKKAKWFKKREKYSMFTRRGFLGEVCHFGYPRTKEGALTTIGMAIAIALFAYIILLG